MLLKMLRLILFAHLLNLETVLDLYGIESSRNRKKRSPPTDTKSLIIAASVDSMIFDLSATLQLLTVGTNDYFESCYCL